ncbi:MAG TPA: RNA repair transcriptional activator RtcR [Kofleriaceae bacterium]|nr:RNA repair transcriptional activator RtcR [Kofleriaceae bacterium]
MTRRRSLVVFGLLGTTLDAGTGPRRWERWRPTVALCGHDDLVVDRLELLVPTGAQALAKVVVADIAQLSPETTVREHPLAIRDPWDLEETYGALFDLVRGYAFAPEREEYLAHITTGTHIAQISLFLLVEARHLPGRLLQTAPPRAGRRPPPGQPVAGEVAIIDLDLARYDRIAARFARDRRDAVSLLKGGIATRNAAFNRLVDELEQVAIGSRDPILLLGPTGAGKSQLARRVYELKKTRRQVEGPLVEVNCATIRGDGAMSALFGHVKGAYTGAVAARPGFLRQADGGVLFLDELGELGLAEQAMLLRALEDRRFVPVGADHEVASDFVLLAGTNRDLPALAARGEFRADLLARLDLWTFRLPGLAERPEDLAPNLDHELEQAGAARNLRVTMTREARDGFLAFATSPAATWPGNFRDLSAAVRRMATLAHGGRISAGDVERELARLRAAWAPFGPRDAALAGADAGALAPADNDREVERLLGPRAGDVDLVDRAQLAAVLRVCRASASLSDAGRRLYAASRTRKTSTNDADRLRKYLARFGLTWAEAAAPLTARSAGSAPAPGWSDRR